ncbi:1934_t:CDS:2 [Entrophospora sp. SA101]|nr:1934_t:CDS:2 [Entrophospora sp. SA101]
MASEFKARCSTEIVTILLFGISLRYEEQEEEQIIKLLSTTSRIMTKKRFEYIDDEYDENEILKYIPSATNTISVGNLAAAHKVMYRESLPLLPQFPRLSKKHKESNTENLTDQEFNARLAEANIFNISDKKNCKFKQDTQNKCR